MPYGYSETPVVFVNALQPLPSIAQPPRNQNSGFSNQNDEGEPGKTTTRNPMRM
jgi:hypothetical protein